MYVILSIIAFFFAPEILHGFAEVLRNFFHVKWDGYAFWLIGFLLWAISTSN